MSLPSLRNAAPEDLETLIAIDDEASKLYAQAGLNLDLGRDHPFVIAEAKRWAGAIDQGLVYLAVDRHGRPVGFATCGIVDREPYLDQLSVMPACMRQGIGTILLKRAIQWSARRPIWLTTYGSIPWNRPYYERHGFVEVPENKLGPDLQDILREQRRVLPKPEDRIAMVRYPD